ncbi:MAG: hypothetical protein AAGI71_01515 [Bacteroidota bacterium]
MDSIASSRTPPSVSKDKWLTHIRRKLAKGYVVIVNDERKTANFFKPGKGYESCAFQAAQAMIESGELVHTGQRPNGLKYELNDAPPAPPPAPAQQRVVVDDDDDEEEDTAQDEFNELLGDLDSDTEEDEVDDDMDDPEPVSADDHYPYADEEDDD